VSSTPHPSQPPVAVIQARSSSRRLPDKVLLELAGKPMLAYTVERLRRCRTVRDVVLATSDRPEDDRVAALGERLGVPVYRGPLDDVLGRFVAAARAFDATAVVRISGDSPLIDPEVVDRVVARLLAATCDLATNVFPRSFPKGQSVEVIALAALERAAAVAVDPEDREHVTRYIYGHPAAFRIENVAFGRDASGVQLSVDTADDLAFIGRILASMTRPHWEYGVEEVLALRQQFLPERAASAAG
jgi:spore coat polysaccharide biosynthesis protein SpsF (cytidylyltransferase family)